MNEQNKKLEVIRKRCERSAKVVEVLQIIIIVITVLCAIATLVLFAESNTLNPILKEQYENGNLSMSNMEIQSALVSGEVKMNEFIEKGQYVVPIIINCIVAVLACALVCFILGIFKNIFRQILKEESPFSEGVLKKMRLGFIIITVLLLLSMGLGAALICGLLCWCIYSIFEYGSAIQTEVDDMV